MLQEKLTQYRIILASGSPRRQQFFKDLELPFTVVLKEIEELFPESLQGAEITDYLANLKSEAFGDLQEEDLLITSDTIVWNKGAALGKPSTYEEAFLMLKQLSDSSHEVFTSICIRTATSKKIVNDCTKVFFNKLTDEEIHYYLKKHQPFDKAGSYGIQDWIGLIGVYKIEGSYFNVVGLPVHKLYKELMNL
jgi:septum formation protein